MSATAIQAPIGAVTAVRPGDRIAAGEVDSWLCDYAASRDPVLRERIILSYLGLADRLAYRYHTSRGTTPEDLRQTARAGLIAAIDRYDPDYGNPFVAYAVACVVGELKRYLRDTSVLRLRFVDNIWRGSQGSHQRSLSPQTAWGPGSRSGSRRGCRLPGRGRWYGRRAGAAWWSAHQTSVRPG